MAASVVPGHGAATAAGRRDTGSVTVEAALGLCSVIAVFMLVLAGAASVVDQIRCTDAAIEAARLTARGEQYRAAEAVARLAPAGASLSVTVHGDEIMSEVRASLPGRFLPGRWLAARAFAIKEPGSAPPAEEVR